MSRISRVIVVVVLLGAIGAVLALKLRSTAPRCPCSGAGTACATHVSGMASEAAGVTNRLPRLVDLGAGKCVSCKAMAPILERLNEDYAGTFEVEFIDVWKDETAAETYGIRMIPTQIFYGADGKELFRHEGFFGREDILTKWQALGLDVDTLDEGVRD